jgi:hypothetical protein
MCPSLFINFLFAVRSEGMGEKRGASIFSPTSPTSPTGSLLAKPLDGPDLIA